MLVYPDFHKPFDVFTDASKQQLGGVVMQENKPLAFYSRKLNFARRRYTIAELELLSIVETFKAYHNILLGQIVNVYTDHKNFTFATFSNKKVTRWQIFLEEYGSHFKYLPGKNNVHTGMNNKPVLNVGPMCREGFLSHEAVFFQNVRLEVHDA